MFRIELAAGTLRAGLGKVAGEDGAF